MEKILIVDDDPAIREIFTIYLEMKGYGILSAPGGTACMDLLTTHKPDLILLDMMMEPMDGWETLLAIRSNPASCRIPVMIITGKSPTPKEILQYGGEIEDFIIKPVDFKQVADSLHHTLDKDRVLLGEIDRISKQEPDKELLGEYARLLRLVRVADNLWKRLEDRSWTEPIPLENQVRRLHWLHDKFGFSDHLLDRGEGK